MIAGLPAKVGSRQIIGLFLFSRKNRYNFDMPRLVKQFIFGAGYLVIFGFIAFGIYALTRVDPTCLDGIQNQGEEGADCGFVCGNTCLASLAPIEVRESYLFKITEDKATGNDYDVLFKIYDPNPRFGVSRLEYEVNLFDAENELFLRKRGFTYVLPGQTKFVFEPAIRTADRQARRAELKIVSVIWERLRGGLGEDINFVIRSKQYVENGKPGVFSHVNGTVFNSSDFDFDRVDLAIILFKENRPIRANRTNLNTFLSGTERYFESDWIHPFGPAPDRVEIEATTNVFESYNFIRKYGTPERFQRLY